MVFVLIHGSHHGAWCWTYVRDALESRGHEVVCPTLRGMGERVAEWSEGAGFKVFVEDVVGAMRERDLRDVVLVGHSLGAIVARGVAIVVPDRLRALVYLDGGLLDYGEALVDRIPERDLRERFNRTLLHNGVRLVMAPAPQDFGISEPEQIAWVKSQLTPQPYSIYTDSFPFKGTPESLVPTTYIQCVQPVHAMASGGLHQATGMGLDIRTLAAGHDAMITAPERVVEHLLALARSPRR